MDVERDLRRQTFKYMYRYQARSEAFAYAWEHRRDPQVILETLREKEDSLADTSRQRSSMEPGASPRLYLEGFVEGLKDAFGVISSVHAVVNPGTWANDEQKLRPIIYRTIIDASARSEAFLFAWKKIDRIDEVESWLHKVEKSGPDLVLIKVIELRIETNTVGTVSDEDELKKSIPFDETLRTYYHAYLNALKAVMEMARESGIEVVKQGA
jgi:hypothetical protein